MITDDSQVMSKLTRILKNIKSKDGSTDLFTHLTKLNTIKHEMEDSSSFFDLFEDISFRIKNSKLQQNNQQTPTFSISEKEKKLLAPLVKAEGEGEPTPVTTVTFVPDYVSLFQKLSYAGISFGDKESLLLSNSLRNLSSTITSGSVQFFGKIIGSEKDYYIAEGVDMDPTGEINYENDMEKIKEDGVNRNIFFVTNDLSEKWVELPVVKPSQIIASRKIRYMFTGDLNRPIHSNPNFVGQEKHLLRCMIARIYHGTKLVPNCIWKYTIEDQESPFKALTEDKEKAKLYTNDDLINYGNWIHYPPGILKCGRVSHNTEEPPEGVEPEDFKKQILSRDPFDKRMGAIRDDKCLKTNFKKDYKNIFPWKIDQYYEDSVYINPYIKVLDPSNPDYDPENVKNNNSNYTLTVVKSLRWPGAVNVLIGTETYFFYIGDGMKVLDEEQPGYCFKDFPKIPEEERDREDMYEPHEPAQAQVEEKKEEQKS